MSKPAKILIVDDHPLVREGLTARISKLPEMTVCGEAPDVESALGLLETTQPDLVVVDLALKDGHGLDLIKRIKASGAAPKILVLTAYDEALFAERALRAGAQGYVHKQEAQNMLITAIRKLLRGEHYLSPRMTQHLIGQAIGERDAAQTVACLSDRELQIFELIGRGKSTREIAAELKLSVHTIETHRERIRAKLHLANGMALTQRAVRWVIENT
jgi:DNA-binding NarL/FixJ family response regulator